MQSTLLTLALTLGCGALALAEPPGNSAPEIKDSIAAKPSGGLSQKPPQLVLAFKCGPGFATYSVKSLSGARGGGVRCVKFHNSETLDGKLVGAYWYGEGQWNGKKYRHIGSTFKSRVCIPVPLGGQHCNDFYHSVAADISGNGENSDNEFRSLSLTSAQGGERIRVSGDWNEEWIREPSGHTSTYSSKLQPVANCGSHLVKAAVADANGSTASGTGVRCLMVISEPGYSEVLWYGEGQWNGKKYRHLGFTSSSYGTAADICNNPAYICGQTASDGLNVEREIMPCEANKEFQFKYFITGAWNELWSGQGNCPAR